MSELKDTDPKSRPAYHKLILFLIQDDIFQSFNSANLDDSPYGKVVKNKIESSLNIYIQDNPDPIISTISDIPVAKIKGWKKEIREYAKNW